VQARVEVRGAALDLGQGFVFAVVVVAFGLFMSGRVRYDVVGLLATVVLVFGGQLPSTEVFHGFANDAVLSVVAVMVVGRAVRLAGAIEPFAVLLLKARGLVGQTFAITGTVTFFSAIMNNTGALAVFLPVAVHMSRAMHRLASALLMPLAFASLLGGLITLIGTPPNILVSSFRQEHMGTSFALLDFARVGLGVAVVGWVFLSTVGWRLLPPRRGSVVTERLLRMDRYFSELEVPQHSELVGRTLRNFSELSLDVNVVGIARDEHRIVAPLADEPVLGGDVLLVEADAAPLHELLLRTDLRQTTSPGGLRPEQFETENIVVREIVIAPRSPLVGRTAAGLRMRWRFGVNLLAVSRQGSRIIRRIPDVRFRAGDVLVIQVRNEAFSDILHQFKCYRLGDEDHPKPSISRLLVTLLIFGSAVTLVALGLFPLGLTFLTAALLLVLTSVLTTRQAIHAVDWPVVILLGSTICMGAALEHSGGAETLARSVMELTKSWPAWSVVGAVLVVTMLLSNVVNNAATVVMMAPIAYTLAIDLGLSPDTFLMAVAVGASSCFLTPIGHQCNTLVLGPGGYHFTDYLRLGGPLSILVILVALPLILHFWPLMP
jgi:di/tricarboxylate transporter